MKARNIVGLSQGAKGEEVIWDEFNGNWEQLAWQSEQLLAKFKGESVENSAEISKEDLPREGKEREILVKARVNQLFFRKTILASYNHSCCITGIEIPELLVASHIVPWSKDPNNRLNPGNGLCLNCLHDSAFDKGIMTITPDYTVRISKQVLREIQKNNPQDKFLLPFEGKKIREPQKFRPVVEFLEYHNQNIFRN